MLLSPIRQWLNSNSSNGADDVYDGVITLITGSLQDCRT